MSTRAAEPDGLPTLTECRAAARSIGAAEFGAEAIGVVRPRGPLGVLRSRGPLPLLLWVAAREGRLVWRGPESLALLRAPGDAVDPLPDRRTALARRIVRGWDTLIFLGTAVLLLAGSALCAVLWSAVGGDFLLWAGLVLALGALLHVAVLLTCGALSLLIGFVRRRGRASASERAAELRSGPRWTMTLGHHVAADPPRLLLDEVRRRLDGILREEATDAAADRGVLLMHGPVTEELVCLRRGMTTGWLRAATDSWSEVVEDGFTLRLADHPAEREPIRIFDRGEFLFWYLGGVAAMVLLLAALVPGWERAVCGDACAGRPATYDLALRWLAQRLLLSDPDGLSPAAGRTAAIGWLVSIMSLTGLLVLVAALRQYVRAGHIENDRAEQRKRRLNAHARTLLIVATTVERDAAVDAVRAVTGREPEPLASHREVLRLGTVSHTDLMLVQVEPGAVRPGSAASDLIGLLGLHSVVLLGICFGLKPDEQQAGDVLVCSQLRGLDHRKTTDAGVEFRGDHVTPSTVLLPRLREAARSWPSRVRFGPLLSASELVDSRARVEQLRREHPDAIGGEMEGAGVYAKAAVAKVDWIVVKAISDWGHGKTDDHQGTAARNAAEFVVHAARQRAFDR